MQCSGEFSPTIGGRSLAKERGYLWQILLIAAHYSGHSARLLVELQIVVGKIASAAPSPPRQKNPWLQIPHPEISEKPRPRSWPHCQEKVRALERKKKSPPSPPRVQTPPAIPVWQPLPRLQKESAPYTREPPPTSS